MMRARVATSARQGIAAKPQVERGHGDGAERVAPPWRGVPGLDRHAQAHDREDHARREHGNHPDGEEPRAVSDEILRRVSRSRFLLRRLVVDHPWAIVSVADISA
jgi:hypothetical protein